VEHSIGYYIKAILADATPVIAILGALSLVSSALFHLSYLINIGDRSVFMMTLTDYLSFSIVMIPLILVPIVIFGILSAAYFIPGHLFNWLESRKMLSPAMH
jgi:hypothetical protein